MAKMWSKARARKRIGLGLAVGLALSVVGPSVAYAHETITVVPGDTLAEIASAEGSSVTAIAAANDIADPDLIYAGSTLTIPSGDGSGAAPSASPSTSSSSTSSSTSAATPSYGGSVEDIIYSAAAEYGVDGGYMVAIANCESGLNPRAVSPAGYYGLFQFDQQTWAEYGSGSIYDPVAQARATARLISMGQSSRWPNCG